jgi:hypothetical protein
MSHRGYTVLGWAVWQIASRVAKKKMAQNRAKIGAVVAIAAVIAAGVIAARAGSDED